MTRCGCARRSEVETAGITFGVPSTSAIRSAAADRRGRHRGPDLIGVQHLHSGPDDCEGAASTISLYCSDKAGNLTSQDGTVSTCPGSAVFTYNDASQLTTQIGSTTPWSYDKLGNETAGGRIAASARTNETWTDDSQLSAITTGGTAYDLVHAGTDNSERTKLGSTWFHHTAPSVIADHRPEDVEPCDGRGPARPGCGAAIHTLHLRAGRPSPVDIDRRRPAHTDRTPH
jgi:hypothetical protein